MTEEARSRLTAHTIFGRTKNRSSPAPGSSRSSCESHHPALREIDPHARAEPPRRMAASSSIQGECPTMRDDRIPGCSPTWSCEADQVGIVGQRARREPAGWATPSDLRQDLGGLHCTDPGTGEHQRRREVVLPQPPAHLALDLATLVGQRAVASRRATGGIARRRRRRGGSGGEASEASERERESEGERESKRASLPHFLPRFPPSPPPRCRSRPGRRGSGCAW